jgi:hypothetical protein
MFNVYFKLTVDDRDFTKVISVSNIPQVGCLLKAANNSFVVEPQGHEQDLDAYAAKEYEHRSFCDSVRACLNERLYSGDDHPEVIEDLLKAGWAEKI